MSEQEWKAAFKSALKTYFVGGDWTEADKEKVAQESADASWPEYPDDDPAECAREEAYHMAQEGGG